MNSHAWKKIAWMKGGVHKAKPEEVLKLKFHSLRDRDKCSLIM